MIHIKKNYKMIFNNTLILMEVIHPELPVNDAECDVSPHKFHKVI